MNELRLNVGAGQTFIPGFTNIDISERAEIQVDLGRESLPFETSSVDMVFSYHTLEHIDDYLFALGEVHRVLRHGGRFLLGVPYVTLTEYNLVNPYHRQNFNEYSFDFFDPARLKGTAAEENPVLFRKIFHRLHYIGAFHVLPPPLRSWCRRHLFNVVRKIDFGLVAIKDPARPTPPAAAVRREMMQEFRACFEARRPYDGDRTRGVAHRSLVRGWLVGAAKWWRGHGA